ncbi:MAG: aspartate aminotransferase family protein [Devosia sp.]|nr:aspartate aminotransferase family protein [Devosia sp.]
MSALYGTYARSGLAFERGEGMRLYDQNGVAYLDFHSGIAVNALGHGDPHLVGALKSAADKVWHTSNVFTIPEQERLGQRLVDATFADSVFFTNSGAEALECAIKTARHYFWAKGETDRYEIIAFTGSFHGRTLGTIAAGGNPNYLEGFGRRLCDEYGMLLVLDEVQCGYGRTGRFFAFEWSNITPDIVAVAKAIGGGFPLGACLARGEVAASMVPGTHGSTYGGNPLATAVGNAVLDRIMEPGFIEHVDQMGQRLAWHLQQLAQRFPDQVLELRGKGLLAGIKITPPVRDFVERLRSDHQLLAIGAGDNVLRLLPPLIVTEADIEEAVGKIAAAFEAIQAETN